MKIIMLVGPPGAGKTTYVAEHRVPEDCQVDMDLIPRQWPQRERRSARKTLLLRAQQSPSPFTCWFSTAAPTREQRSYWRSFVRIHETIILLPTLELAIERQVARDGPGHHLTTQIPKWFEQFSRREALLEPNTCVINVT